MSLPSDGARPVALWTPGTEPEQMRECNGTEAETTFYVLAADYDALRADRDSWLEQASARVADWDEMRIRAEAAEAKVAAFKECMDRWGSWHDGCFYYNNIAAPELGAALNEGDGE